MASTPTQSTAAFTVTNSVLDWKEGWTVAYSTLLLDNDLYCKDSIERHHAIVDQIGFGSSPAPSALGTAQTERIGGQMAWYYVVASGATGTVTLDQSIDWRDRIVSWWLMYKASTTYIPGTANDNDISANNQGSTGPVGAAYYAGTFYTEQGSAAAGQCGLGTTEHSLLADSTNGYLKLTYGAPTSNAASFTCNMVYSPMLGQQTAT